jgi:hypothetical protein
MSPPPPSLAPAEASASLNSNDRSSLASLPPDALAEVSKSLSDRALASLALSDRALRDAVASDAVWLERGARWRLIDGPSSSSSTTTTSALARYRAAHGAARRLRGAPIALDAPLPTTAAAASWERLPAQEPPRRALLLLSSADRDAPPDSWSLPEVCATQDERLWWWRPPLVQATEDSTLSSPPPPPPPPFRSADAERERRRWLRGPARRASETRAGAGHTAAVEVVVALGGGGGGGAGGLPPGGYASGALDRTIKLWRPFPPAAAAAAAAAARRRREGDDDDDHEGGDDGGALGGGEPVSIAPSRTLRGHQEGVTALACVPVVASASSSLLLASASLDRTVRLWQLPPALGGGGGGSGSGGGRSAASPLLATLRGHGGGVSSLALLSPCTAPHLLASAGMDLRVKIWDVGRAGASGGGGSDGGGSGSGSGGGGASSPSSPSSAPPSAALVSTHRLSAAPLHLLPLGSAEAPSSSSSSSPPALDRCLVAVSHASFELVDARVGCPVAAVALSRSLAPVRCCAADPANARLAVGHRAGASVYDLRRMAGGGGGTGRAGSSSSAPPPPSPLFSVAHPRRAPCDALALDRDKLVTATAAVRLHKGHAVWVWEARGGGGGGGEGAVEPGALVARHSAAANPVQLADDSLPAPSPAAGTFDALFTGGEEAAWELLSAMEAEPAAAVVAAAAPPAGGGEEGDDAFWDGAPAAGAGESSSSRPKFYGRLEPGVLALALSCGGTVLGTVDTLGSAVVRDFRRLPAACRAAGGGGGGVGGGIGGGLDDSEEDWGGDGSRGGPGPDGSGFWEAPPT